jgi:hypothetical protein
MLAGIQIPIPDSDKMIMIDDIFGAKSSASATCANRHPGSGNFRTRPRARPSKYASTGLGGWMSFFLHSRRSFIYPCGYDEPRIIGSCLLQLLTYLPALTT